MKKLTFTPEQLIQIENATNFSASFQLGEDERTITLNVFEDGTMSYDIEGAYGIGLGYTWDGISFEELEEWKKLVEVLEKGNVVVNENNEEFLLYEIDEEEIQIFCQGNVKWENGWIDEKGNPEEGVTIGECWLCSGHAVWGWEKCVSQKNTEVSNPYRIDDFKYNGSFFEMN